MEQDLSLVWRLLNDCMRQLEGMTVTVTTRDGTRIEHFRPRDFITTSLVHVRGVVDDHATTASTVTFDLSDIREISLEHGVHDAPLRAQAPAAEPAMRFSA